MPGERTFGYINARQRCLGRMDEPQLIRAGGKGLVISYPESEIIKALPPFLLSKNQPAISSGSFRVYRYLIGIEGHRRHKGAAVMPQNAFA